MAEESITKNLVADKLGKSGSEDALIEKRKREIFKFLKKRYEWVTYVLLAVIVLLAVRIRTLNIPGLKDITTGTWTLGPDLDPFLFLRWAKYIIANGSLMAVDMMRYVPLGYDTRGELLLHPYLMAWFHKVASFFGSVSVTQSAIIYPVFMFALTVIAFFLMVRKVFNGHLGNKRANVIALIASFFLSIMPALLPRTIAGIPEKESSAFLFLFLAFYFFLCAWNSKKNLSGYLFAILAGASSAGMALVWGGYPFIFLTISPIVFVSFLLGKVDKKKIVYYGIWLVVAFALMWPFSTRYLLRVLLADTNTGPAVAVLFILIVHNVIYRTKIKDYFRGKKIEKVPSEITSSVISIVLLLVIALSSMGPSFVFDQIHFVYDNLFNPTTERLLQTVAENRQPYFAEWAGSYGPSIKGVLLIFWLSFIGAVWLFNSAIKSLKKKDKIILTTVYVIFLLGITFTRYSSGGTFNGTSGLSILLYVTSFLIFLLALGYIYWQNYKRGDKEPLEMIKFEYMFVSLIWILTLLLARSSIRLILMVAPAASIMLSFVVVTSLDNFLKSKRGTKKILSGIVAAIIILSAAFSAYAYYGATSAEAQAYIPSGYTQQWQKAMAWVRDNAPENAVFGHWWDYGYWVQSIGERATVLDGGNAISYWNYFMGRYALTGSDYTEALEFLYAHNTTHFLIDSTDIGKYSAFSTIGSDVNYDRASFIPTFVRDPEQTQELKNSVIFVYLGGVGLDADIVYETNGTKIFLPAGKAGLGAILVEKNLLNGEMANQPVGIFVYSGQQYRIPFRYAFDGTFRDFGTGLPSGIFLMPKAEQSGNSLKIEDDGALLYLSERTVKSQLARIYLYGEDEDSHFELVHKEDDSIISQIKTQKNSDFDFLYFNGLRGPIKIWEIHYPENIVFKDEYLQKEYPEELKIAE